MDVATLGAAQAYSEELVAGASNLTDLAGTAVQNYINGATNLVTDDNVGSKINDYLTENQISTHGTPQMYGAVGDGETDDYEAIQTALNNHLVVFIPATEKGYCISKSLRMTKSGQRLYGESKQAIIVSGDALRSTIFPTNDFSDEYMLIVPHENYGCSIESVTIRGNAWNSNVINGINMNENTDGDTTSRGYHLLRDVWVQRLSGNGIDWGYYSWDNHLDNVFIKHCDGVGLTFEGTDSSFSTVYVSDCGDNGIVINNGANAFSNCKSYCNGRINHDAYGVVVNGNHNRFATLNSQQNYSNGLIISGDFNIFDGLVVDGNGCEVENNELSSIVINGNKNTVNGSIIGNFLQGNTKYGLTVTPNAVAMNRINLIIDEQDRSLASTEKYINLPAMTDTNFAFNNAFNSIVINGENAISEETFASMDSLIVTSAGAAYELTDGVYNITPSQVEESHNIAFRWVASKLDTTKPVLLMKANCIADRTFFVNARLMVTHATDGTSKEEYIDISANVSNCYSERKTALYFACDLEALGIDVSTITWIQAIFRIGGNDTANAHTIQLINPQCCWIGHNNNYVEPVLN